MEKIEFEKQLFEAIKKDDLKSFISLMPTNSDLNLCYGRFPLLSLMYLYSSFKLISKYEKLLMPVHNFKQAVSEPFEIYETFKRHARKSLRLFEDDKIVYPILMLAVLNEKIILTNNYKFLYKNEEISQKLQKIYKINYNLAVKPQGVSIEIQRENVTKRQKFIFGVISFVCCLLIALSSVLIALVSNNIGFGTASKPIKISSANEFIQALKNGNQYYVLTSNISISGGTVVNEFSGTISGGDYVVTIDGDFDSPLIKKLSGNLKNLKIKCNNNKLKITQNSSIIAENLTGNIENCEIFGQFNVEYNSSEDAYFGLFASFNEGTISNSKTRVSASLVNNNQTNAYFASMVGINQENAKINNCVAEAGTILADTVDIAGIACQNYGELNLCENNLSLTQTSSKEWHPNVAGVVIQNYGNVIDSINKGELFAESSVKASDDNVYYVFVGGVVCDNYGKIVDSKNYGCITGKGESSNVVIGGIAAQNIYSQNYDGTISSSLSKNDIFAFSESGQVCTGGAVGVNGAILLLSGFVGSIDANSNSSEDKQVFVNKLEKPATVFAGGVVGINQASPVQKCYADVNFLNVSESEDVIKTYAGVIANVGIIKYKVRTNEGDESYDNLDRQEVLSGAFTYLSNNYFVKNVSVKLAGTGIYAIYLKQNIVNLTYQTGELREITEQMISDIYNESVKVFIECKDISEIPTEVIIDG